MKFSELGLAEPLNRATSKQGYEIATPIQVKAIPVVLSGRDLIGCAQTGTGKTAAFTLPLLHRLIGNVNGRSSKQSKSQGSSGKSQKKQKPRKLRALVLVPTRELAAQIEGSLARYGRYTDIRQTSVVGGVSQHHQVKALQNGVDVLVATPGRLLDLMGQGYIELATIETLVLDEADQMLDMGFLPDLKKIVAAVPTKRQTLMFSATMPEQIRRLARQWLTDPTSIQIARISAPAERIAQTVHLVDQKRKQDLLSRFLQETPQSRTLVFSRTKHGADKIVKRLNRDGVPAVAIHGDKSQSARNRALARFKSKSPPVLVATDIAARGLDIDDVSHVVNFDLPEVPETYVHRIGRTARAGGSGVAVSFCSTDERALLKQIERLTKRTIEVEPVLDGFEPTKSGGSRRRKTNGKPNSKKSRRRPHTKAKSNATGKRKSKRKKPVGNAAAGGRRRKQRRSTATVSS